MTILPRTARSMSADDGNPSTPGRTWPRTKGDDIPFDDLPAENPNLLSASYGAGTDPELTAALAEADFERVVAQNLSMLAVR